MPIDPSSLNLNELIGGAAGSGGVGAILLFFFKFWTRTQAKQHCAITTAILDLKKEVKDDVAGLKLEIQTDISKLQTALEKQMAEFATQLKEQAAELRHQDKDMSKLETRLALAEDRVAVAQQVGRAVDDLRERVITNTTQLTGKIDALYDILKGKRKMWDAEDKPA